MIKSPTTSDLSVLAFGELLWDLLPSGKVLGGAPANFANRLRLYDKTVGLVSRVGNDDLGQAAIHQLLELGLSDSFLQHDSIHSTGTVDVTLTPDGNPHFTIIQDVAYDYIETSKNLFEAASKCSVFYFGTLIQRHQVSRTTLYSLLEAANNALHFLDINLRRECYSAQTIKESLSRADVLKLNRDEIKTLSKMFGLIDQDIMSFAHSIFETSPVKTILVTLGESGVFCVNRESAPIYVPGCRVEVADTIGAGDAFSAGFIIKYLENCDLRECLDFGNSIAAISATKKGGMGVISRAEVSEFRAKSTRKSILKELEQYEHGHPNG